MTTRKPQLVMVGLMALSLLIGCAAGEDGLTGVSGSGRRTATPTPGPTASPTASPSAGTATPTPKPTLTPWPSPTPTPTPSLEPLPDPVGGPSTGDIDPPPESTESIGVE